MSQMRRVESVGVAHARSRPCGHQLSDVIGCDVKQFKGLQTALKKKKEYHYQMNRKLIIHVL